MYNTCIWCVLMGILDSWKRWCVCVWGGGGGVALVFDFCACVCSLLPSLSSWAIGQSSLSFASQSHMCLLSTTLGLQNMYCTQTSLASSHSSSSLPSLSLSLSLSSQLWKFRYFSSGLLMDTDHYPEHMKTVDQLIASGEAGRQVAREIAEENKVRH